MTAEARFDEPGGPRCSSARARFAFTHARRAVGRLRRSRGAAARLLRSTMNFVDLQFLGLQRVIGTAVLEGPSGLTLIDPGPTSCLPALESGLATRPPARRRQHAAADAHPSRSCGRDRDAAAAPAARRRLRARARRAAHDRSSQAAGQRDTPLRPQHGSFLGRVPSGAR